MQPEANMGIVTFKILKNPPFFLTRVNITSTLSFAFLVASRSPSASIPFAYFRGPSNFIVFILGWPPQYIYMYI